MLKAACPIRVGAGFFWGISPAPHSDPPYKLAPVQVSFRTSSLQILQVAKSFSEVFTPINSWRLREASL